MVTGSASPTNSRTPSLIDTPAGTVSAWDSSFLLPELIDQISTTFLLSAVILDWRSVQRFGALSSCWVQTTSQLPNDFSMRLAALAPLPTRAATQAAKRAGSTKRAATLD